MVLENAVTSSLSFEVDTRRDRKEATSAHHRKMFRAYPTRGSRVALPFLGVPEHHSGSVVKFCGRCKRACVADRSVMSWTSSDSEQQQQQLRHLYDPLKLSTSPLDYSHIIIGTLNLASQPRLFSIHLSPPPTFCQVLLVPKRLQINMQPTTADPKPLVVAEQPTAKNMMSTFSSPRYGTQML